MFNANSQQNNLNSLLQNPASFGGFVSYGTTKNLKEHTEYKLRLIQGVRIGDRIQYVAALQSSNGGKVVGYLVENLAIGTWYYQQFVQNVFLPTDTGIIAVDLSRLNEVAGTIQLVKCRGRLHLNWETFEPEATLVNFVAQ